MVILSLFKRYSSSIPIDSLFLYQDDVLKARLKTVGVCEYKFEMEVTAGRDSGTEWRIIDVGGSRSQVSYISPVLCLTNRI